MVQEKTNLINNYKVSFINRIPLINKRLIVSVLFYSTITWQVIYFVITTDIATPVSKYTTDIQSITSPASGIIQIAVNDKSESVENPDRNPPQNQLYIPNIKFSYPIDLTVYITSANIIFYQSALSDVIKSRGPPDCNNNNNI